jgi:hypothetical protein
MGHPWLIVGLETAPPAFEAPVPIFNKLSGHCGRFEQSQPRKFGLDINLERPVEMLLEMTSQLGLARVEASVKQSAGQRILRFEPPERHRETSRCRSGGSPAGVVESEWLGGLMQMTTSSTKRESWRLVYGLRKFRVPKQQERALAAVTLDGIALMLNVTFSTRTFALLLTHLEAIAVWNAPHFHE